MVHKTKTTVPAHCSYEILWLDLHVIYKHTLLKKEIQVSACTDSFDFAGDAYWANCIIRSYLNCSFS